MNLDEIVRTISEAAVMADYKFDKYKSDKKDFNLRRIYHNIYPREMN